MHDNNSTHSSSKQAINPLAQLASSLLLCRRITPTSTPTAGRRIVARVSSARTRVVVRAPIGVAVVVRPIAIGYLVLASVSSAFKGSIICWGGGKEDNEEDDYRKALKEITKQDSSGSPIRVVIAVRIRSTLAVVAGAVMVTLFST